MMNVTEREISEIVRELYVSTPWSATWWDQQIRELLRSDLWTSLEDLVADAKRCAAANIPPTVLVAFANGWQVRP